MSALSDVNRRVMARDDSENFRIRPGRSRNGRARINPRTQPFLKQVQIAVRKAGGDPRRIASGARMGGGRFAMIDNGLGFQLAPWLPMLERHIGRHISGLQREDGGIEWTLGRNRGLSHNAASATAASRGWLARP